MPRYHNDPGDLLRQHGAALHECLGEAIEATWVAWDVKDEVWFPDEAVILCIAGRSLEIVCRKLDEVALSWNAIDLQDPPAWVADWSFELTWRRDAIDGLSQVVGAPIRGINVLEYLHRTTVVSAPQKPALVGNTSETWLLHGLEFEFSDTVLTVFNALDENGISLDRSQGPDFRRHRVRKSA